LGHRFQLEHSWSCGIRRLGRLHRAFARCDRWRGLPAA
jgi:hypothetical protein